VGGWRGAGWEAGEGEVDGVEVRLEGLAGRMDGWGGGTTNTTARHLGGGGGYDNPVLH
jgi:hypothetical protein